MKLLLAAIVPALLAQSLISNAFAGEKHVSHVSLNCTITAEMDLDLYETPVKDVCTFNKGCEDFNATADISTDFYVPNSYYYSNWVINWEGSILRYNHHSVTDYGEDFLYNADPGGPSSGSIITDGPLEGYKASYGAAFKYEFNMRVDSPDRFWKSSKKRLIACKIGAVR
jgi:hypothetical protein